MASYQYVYVMKDLTKAFPGGREVFRGITLAFLPGVKIGVLGVNGAGKSTLLKIMAGLDTEFGGEAWAAEGARVGYLEQEPQLDPDKTVGENVEQAFADLKAALDRFNEISMKFAEPMSDEEMNTLLSEQADLQEKIDAEDGWDLDRRVDIALDALRCPPADAAVATLSGGERRRVALCRLLLEKPDLLLLDEPTNHLDAESVAWLEHTLRDYAGTVMVVTHDRYFLDNVTGWILEIERGRGYPFEGNYSSWLEQKRKRLAQEEKEESARQRALAAEQEWIAASPRARQAKNRARIQRYEEMLARSQELVGGVAEIVIPPGPRLGNVVIEAEGLRKGYGNNLLIDDLNFRLPPGGIVGVIGPNGAGKTTLFRMIIGQEQPDAGALRVGETVKLGYVDQSRDSLNADKTVWQEISGGEDMIYLGKRGVHVARLCQRVQLQGAGPAEEGRHPVGRRAQPGASGEDAEDRAQRDPARRADQRPRRGHAARAGGCADRVRRLRGDHQPRPLVPRPAGDAHPGVRGRQPRGVVRGQLRGLRGGQAAAAGRGRDRAAPDQVPAAGAVMPGPLWVGPANPGPSCTAAIALRLWQSDRTVRQTCTQHVRLCTNFSQPSVRRLVTSAPGSSVKPRSVNPLAHPLSCEPLHNPSAN